MSRTSRWVQAATLAFVEIVIAPSSAQAATPPAPAGAAAPVPNKPILHSNSKPVLPLPGGDPGQIYVFGKRLEGIGDATAASQGAVSFAKFEDRPLLRPGELVEVIPGMAATQHSSNTKANQYFLRGFNLDHGTDFSVRPIVSRSFR